MAKVIFLHLSVILFTGRVCLSPGGVLSLGGVLSPGGCLVWRGWVDGGLVWGVSGPGVSGLGGLVWGGGVWSARGTPL